MQYNTESFNRIGVKVESVEKFNETLEVTLTVGQLGKLTEICPANIMGLAENSRLRVRVNISDLEFAIANNVRPARRSGGVSVDIASETVYTISTGDNAVNDVTEARWDSAAKDGMIYINGVGFQIRTGSAHEFYEVGEESDPDRTVYFVEFLAKSDKPDTEDVTDMVVSYGITNLIRSIASYKQTISPVN